MTDRLLIIPAAGLGSRLQSSTPKVLYPVAGRPMIDRLLDLYAPFVDRFVLVLHPAFAEAVQRHCSSSKLSIEYTVQEKPTGMLDAILIPEDCVRRHQPRQIWITWCDQIAVFPETIRTLATIADRETEAAMVMPSIVRSDPYIHIVRDDSGRITDLLHRREGDPLPETGEGDLGLFSLSRKAYLELLPQFSREAITGRNTRERNFLPFIPWVAGRGGVVTFPALDLIESVGVNNAADVRQIEERLSHA